MTRLWFDHYAFERRPRLMLFSATVDYIVRSLRVYATSPIQPKGRPCTQEYNAVATTVRCYYRVFLLSHCVLILNWIHAWSGKGLTSQISMLFFYTGHIWIYLSVYIQIYFPRRLLCSFVLNVLLDQYNVVVSWSRDCAWTVCNEWIKCHYELAS